MSAGIAPDRDKDRKCFAANTLFGVLHGQRSAKLSENPLLTGNYVRRMFIGQRPDKMGWNF